jgi:catechol 2,3-dioxygenase-like lactoylglutathione lyase family enzyme
MDTADAKALFPIALDAVILECRDVAALSDFYIRLLGWKKNHEGDDEWVEIVSPSSDVKIAFQRNDDYIPPVWPDEPGAQQQMVHLDFTVRDKEQMELAVQYAICRGAMKAGAQYDAEKWVTMLDPAGHPFCFVIWH